MEGVPKVKESSFKCLLEAGAASVVMETELSLSTHVFVDLSHLKSSGNVRDIFTVQQEDSWKFFVFLKIRRLTFLNL